MANAQPNWQRSTLGLSAQQSSAAQPHVVPPAPSAGGASPAVPTPLQQPVAPAVSLGAPAVPPSLGLAPGALAPASASTTAPLTAESIAARAPPGTALRKNLSGQGRQLLQAGLRQRQAPPGVGAPADVAAAAAAAPAAQAGIVPRHFCCRPKGLHLISSVYRQISASLPFKHLITVPSFSVHEAEL